MTDKLSPEHIKWLAENLHKRATELEYGFDCDLDDAGDAIEQLIAELAKVTAERNQLSDGYSVADEQIEVLRAANEKLRAALKPFADWIEQRDSNYTTAGYPDYCPLMYYPEGINTGAATVGDLRRARKAIS